MSDDFWKDVFVALTKAEKYEALMRYFERNKYIEDDEFYALTGVNLNSIQSVMEMQNELNRTKWKLEKTEGELRAAKEKEEHDGDTV